MGGSGGGSSFRGPTKGNGDNGSTGESGSEVPGKKEFNCDELAFSTNVFGLVHGLVDRVSKGDVLSIVLSDEDGDSPVVAVNLPNGERLGSIAGCNQLPELVKCLQEGVNYKAKVINTDGSQITIEVSRE